MNRSSKYLIKIVEKNGFYFKRSKGSHQIYYNANTNDHSYSDAWQERFTEGNVFWHLKTSRD